MVTLDEIVEGYCSQFQRPESEYFRITQIGIRGLRLFHRDSTGFPQTAELTVLANGTAVLPTNAMNRISCGILNNMGELASLTYDPNLTLFESTDTARKNQSTNDLIINNEQFVVAFQESNGLTPLYGYGQYGVGGQPNLGSYNIDWEHRVIVFNFGFNKPTVLFTYLGLFCADGNYLVDDLFYEPLISYLDWQDKKGKGRLRVCKNGKSAEEIDFDKQYLNARKAQEPFSLSDQYSEYLRSQRLSVKTA